MPSPDRPRSHRNGRVWRECKKDWSKRPWRSTPAINVLVSPRRLVTRRRHGAGAAAAAGKSVHTVPLGDTDQIARVALLALCQKCGSRQDKPLPLFSQPLCWVHVVFSNAVHGKLMAGFAMKGPSCDFEVAPGRAGVFEELLVALLQQKLPHHQQQRQRRGRTNRIHLRPRGVMKIRPQEHSTHGAKHPRTAQQIIQRNAA